MPDPATKSGTAEETHTSPDLACCITLRRNVDRDTADVFVAHLHFAGVDAQPSFETQSSHAISQSGRAPNRDARTIENGQHPIASAPDTATIEASDLSLNQLIVPFQSFTPANVAHLGSDRGGTDEIGEQHRCQDALGNGHRVWRPRDERPHLCHRIRSRGDRAVRSGELHVVGTGDVIGQVATVINADVPVLGSVQAFISRIEGPRDNPDVPITR
jgi:hypothetical protein